MNDEARSVVVAALVRLSESDDYRDRADAGHGLASFAEVAGARELLVELVLDAGDTFVTRATAEALLRRQDAIGLAAVASALAIADANHADWIHTTVVDVFGVYSRDRDAAVRVCEALIRDPDERLRRGAERLIATLTEINPVLYPAQND
jgi:hypothetical protein